MLSGNFHSNHNPTDLPGRLLATGKGEDQTQNQKNCKNTFHPNTSFVGIRMCVKQTSIAGK